MSRASFGVSSEASKSIVVLASGTTALQPEVHANRLLIVDTSNALYTLNLPRAYGTGDVYEILSTQARTSNLVINAVAAAPSNYFVGTIFQHGSGNVMTKFASTANDIITLNQTTTGGVAAGDYLKLIDAAPAVWRVVFGLFTTSGSQATPFSG
jgi:hypothetical protein